MTPLEIAIGVAATSRLTRLVAQDEITRPLREKVPMGGRAEYLVNCPYCVSVWAGALVASGLVPRRVTAALAFSAAAIWIHEASESQRVRRQAMEESI